MHPSMFPDEFGAVFLAQVTAFALVQIWRSGRKASRQELGNRPRPARDRIHLVLTGLAVVCGLVLLIIFIAHPIANFPGSGGFIAPVVAFLIFIYVVLIVGISSSHHTSRQVKLLDHWSFDVYECDAPTRGDGSTHVLAAPHPYSTPISNVA